VIDFLEKAFAKNFKISNFQAPTIVKPKIEIASMPSFNMQM
jgi:hypothetical protein